MTVSGEYFSLMYLDELRNAIAEDTISSDYHYSVETASDSSVIRLSRTQGEDNVDGALTLRLIHLAVMMGLTRYYVQPPIPLSFILPHAKAVIMAQHHFNNRIESVVPNLKALLAECDVRMTLDFYDSQSSPAIGTTLLVDHIYERSFPYQATAMQGEVLSTVSVATAILNSLHRLPQISHASTDVRFDQDRDTYRFFGRTIAANTGDAVAAMEYFRSVLQVQHVGILYVPSTFGESFKTALVEWGTQHGMMTKTAAIELDQKDMSHANASGNGGLQRSIRDALSILKASGYRYFMALTFTEHFEALLTEATSAGVMGPGHFWMFTMSMSPQFLTSLRYPAASPEAQSLHGIGIVSRGITNE